MNKSKENQFYSCVKRERIFDKRMNSVIDWIDYETTIKLIIKIVLIDTENCFVLNEKCDFQLRLWRREMML